MQEGTACATLGKASSASWRENHAQGSVACMEVMRVIVREMARQMNQVLATHAAAAAAAAAAAGTVGRRGDG